MTQIALSRYKTLRIYPHVYFVVLIFCTYACIPIHIAIDKKKEKKRTNLTQVYYHTYTHTHTHTEMNVL